MTPATRRQRVFRVPPVIACLCRHFRLAPTHGDGGLTRPLATVYRGSTLRHFISAAQDRSPERLPYLFASLSASGCLVCSSYLQVAQRVACVPYFLRKYSAFLFAF